MMLKTRGGEPIRGQALKGCGVMTSPRGWGLHDAVATAAGLVFLLQRLDVDVELLDLLPDSPNCCCRHVLRQLEDEEEGGVRRGGGRGEKLVKNVSKTFINYKTN